MHIEVNGHNRPDDERCLTLSTDRPGGQPISDPEDLRRPIRPHYANFSELHMSTDFQVSVRVLASSHTQPAPFLHNPSLIAVIIPVLANIVRDFQFPLNKHCKRFFQLMKVRQN